MTAWGWLPKGVAVGFVLGAAAVTGPTTLISPAAAQSGVSFTYNNHSYPSADAALDAYRKDIAANIAALPTEADPIRGRARIVIADRDRLRPTTSNGDYYIEAARLREQEIADSIVRAHVFESATIVEQNDTRNPDIGDAEFLVWFQVQSASVNNTGPWTTSWQIRRRTSDSTTRLTFDPGAAAGTSRTAAFLKSMRDTALRLGGTTAGGAKPALVATTPTAPATPAAPQTTTTTATITFDNIKYATPEAALTAQRELIAKQLASLSKEPDPIQGRVRIVLADRDRLRALFVVQARTLSTTLVDYLVENQRLGEHEIADAIVQTRMFETATKIEQNETAQPEIGDNDFIVWFQVRSIGANNVGPWVSGWWMRHKSGPATMQVAFDPGIAIGLPRTIAFLKTMRETALKLGGATGSGAHATVANVTASSGSGFVIDRAGRIITNNHVVQSCSEVRVTDTARVTSVAKVVAKDQANDLALLKVDRVWETTARLRETRSVRAGESIVVTGYPLSGLVGSDMSVTTGSITSLTGPADDSRLVQLSAPIQPGNSGGPLLDSAGNVIGAVSSTLNALRIAVATGGAIPQNVNFAIKASIIRNFLDANNIDVATTSARPEHDLPAPDVADIGRGFTVRVECMR